MYSETRTLKARNEDAIGIGRNIAFVLDGATALLPCVDGYTPAWLAESLKQILLEDDGSLSLQALLKRAARLLKKQVPDIPDQRKPVCTVSAIRVEGDILKYLCLGDSPLLIETNHGVVRIENELLNSLEETAIEIMKQKADELNIPFLQTRNLPEIAQMFIDHRNFQNRPDGYGIFTFSLDWRGLETTGSLPLENVKSVLIMSDGFAYLQDFLKLSDQDFMDWMKVNSKTALDLLESFLNDDETAQKVPRIKKQDDLSFVLIDDPDALKTDRS